MKPKAGRKRLDLLLVERGCAESPQKAMAMILAGEVQVDGQRTEKAGTPVAEDARIEIISRLQKFVSRGGTKLEGALEDFRDRKSTRLNSSHLVISYAVFCLKKKN